MQTVLEQLDRPLLATSAHVPEQDGLEIPEGAVLMDMLAGSGVAFVVDAGMQVGELLSSNLTAPAARHGIDVALPAGQVAEGSTVIDLTGLEPELLRQGKGDAGPFVPDLATVT